MADLPPADWYTDPDDASQYRYWDGSRWTDHRAPRHSTRAGHRTLGALLSGTWSTARQHWRPLLVICAVIVAVYLAGEQAMRAAYGDLFGETLDGWLDDMASVDVDDDQAVSQITEDRLNEISQRWDRLGGATVANRSLLLAAGLAVAVTVNLAEFSAFGHFGLARLRGQPVGAVAALRAGLRRVLRLVGAALMLVVTLGAVLMVTSLVAAGLALAGVPAAVIVAAVLAALVFAAPLALFTLMTAAVGPPEPSMRYARGLLRGNYWKTVLRMFVVTVLLTVATAVILLVGELVGAVSGSLGATVTTALSVLPEMLFCLACFTLYHDLGGEHVIRPVPRRRRPAET